MKIGFFANTDWYLYNFRMPLANYLRENGHVVVMICPQGDYCDLLEKSGFEVVKVPLNRKSIKPVLISSVNPSFCKRSLMSNKSRGC